MKKILLAYLLVFGSLLFPAAGSFAQGMMGYVNQTIENSTISSQQQEEQDGKKLLDNLTQKTVTCSSLSESDFEKIGEYFMGQSIGDTQRHIVMNEMMQRMMGQTGEEQMHTVMGKRFSGCDTAVAFPAQNVGFMSMMNIMGAGGAIYGPSRGYSSMMSFGYGLGNYQVGFFTVIWTIFGVIGIIALVKWVIARIYRTKKQ